MRFICLFQTCILKLNARTYPGVLHCLEAPRRHVDELYTSGRLLEVWLGDERPTLAAQ